MDSLFVSEMTGWLVAALTATTICIGLFARRWLAQHFWIGYAIGGLSFVHASFSMGGLAVAGQAALTGALIATLGMFASWGQALLGSRLRALSGRRRVVVRRFHLTTATLLVLVGVVHVLLNGPFVRGLLNL